MWRRFCWPGYLLALVVLILSFLLSRYFSATELLQKLSMVPGFFALIDVLYMIFKDYLSFERQKELQDRNNAFSLSIASHMSNTTFDKHVQFCEAYIAAMKEGLEKLFNAGPTKEATDLANKLSEVRKEYCAWLSDDIEKEILPLELALRKVGNGIQISTVLSPGKDKSAFLEMAYKEFMVIFSIDSAVSDTDKAKAAINIQACLRGLLGINDITALRKRSLQVAVKSLQQ
jgi:hypothetical protein